MSNNKQSCVDAIIKFMKENGYFIGNDLYQFFNQAKAMHKEELTDAYHDGKTNGMDISHPLSLTKEISANEWYNETYANESNN